MRDINSVNDIQELLKKQKQFMKNVLIMQEKLFEIQARISELTFKEIEKSKKPKSTPSNILTSKDVMSMLKISSSTLYRLQVQNKLPSKKIDGRKFVYFDRKDVMDYLNGKYNK